MKKTFKKIIPRWGIKFLKLVKQVLSVSRLYYYDYTRFLRYSGAVSGDNRNQDSLLSAISMDYHRIEKGLSLKNTRYKFGMNYIPNLVKNMILYKEKYGEHQVLKASLDAMKSYINFHEINEIDFSEIEDSKKQIYSVFSENSKFENSVVACSKQEIVDKVSEIDFENFTKSRHSIRSFLSELVEKEVIDKAVKIAINTPSVCNRQPWRVYSITGEKVVQALLFQNGNRGFNDQINNLIIIVGKLSNMRNTTERRQVFIDGGLFSMSLMYAFHSMAIGTCPLNWCVTINNDKKVREVIPIKEDEEIIMYLAIGYLNDSFEVTKSPRYHSSEILNHIR